METFWIIISISLYIVTCIFFYFFAGMSKTFDENFSVKNLILTLTWPLSMWFLK